LDAADTEGGDHRHGEPHRGHLLQKRSPVIAGRLGFVLVTH
jgi:hypothetical protein